MNTEDNVTSELQALSHWMKELEKQRTSTIEKNLMENFEEFKKGVDEKIGTEDYDTRYNLGIAYKEWDSSKRPSTNFSFHPTSSEILRFRRSAGHVFPGKGNERRSHRLV